MRKAREKPEGRGKKQTKPFNALRFFPNLIWPPNKKKRSPNKTRHKGQGRSQKNINKRT